jgi:hypothetical protein
MSKSPEISFTIPLHTAAIRLIFNAGKEKSVSYYIKIGISLQFLAQCILLCYNIETKAIIQHGKSRFRLSAVLP